MKNKPKIHIAVKIAVAVVIVAAAVFFLRGTIGRLIKPVYDASAPTAAKFAKLSKWIPDGTEFDLSVDVTRALANPQIKEGVARVVKSKGGLIAELVAALITKQDAIGMLTLAGIFGEKGTHPKVVVIAQGSFDEDTMIPAIRVALAAGHAGLASETLGKHTLYVESDARDPFGFIILDRTHIAVGNKASLVELFGKPREKTPVVARLTNSLLFGHLIFGPRLAALMPRGLPVSSIDFESSDGKLLTAKVPSSNPAEAHTLQMFLEGMRSLLLLQEEGNAALASILRAISVQNTGNETTITCNTLALLNLW